MNWMATAWQIWANQPTKQASHPAIHDHIYMLQLLSQVALAMLHSCRKAQVWPGPKPTALSRSQVSFSSSPFSFPKPQSMLRLCHAMLEEYTIS